VPLVLYRILFLGELLLHSGGAAAMRAALVLDMLRNVTVTMGCLPEALIARRLGLLSAGNYPIKQPKCLQTSGCLNPK
jgi:hypothetical protein